MAVEILQHDISGELYAAVYADGVHLASLKQLAGPLTREDALALIDDSEPFIDSDPEDVAWALRQPWSPWQGEALARADVVSGG